MVLPAVVQKLMDEFKGRRPMRAKSLVITFFGDIVSQHGHTIWLGNLIPAMAHFGINERLVRTSVFRLVQEDWLEANRVGRRSYYRFSAYGEHEYERAAARIYSLKEDAWSGRWQLVMPVNVADSVKDRLARSLRWQGYRPIGTGVLAKPGIGGAELRETLEEFGVLGDALVMEADTPEFSSPGLIRDLVYRSWNLAEVAEGYSDFLSRFKPLLTWLQLETQLEPETALIIRLLLIQDYRRLLLKDTPIPAELLPDAWPGIEARSTAAEIYKLIAGPSVGYITTRFEGDKGALPDLSRTFDARFTSSG